MSTRFAELVVATNFSFLRGASQPTDMVARAIQLGMTGIGIADRNTVTGVVRSHVALREARNEIDRDIDFKLVAGAAVFGVGAAVVLVAWEFGLARGRERDQCFRAFLHNNWVGLAVFAGIAADFALRARVAVT